MSSNFPFASFYYHIFPCFSLNFPSDYTMTTKPAAALVSRYEKSSLNFHFHCLPETLFSGECTFGTKAALARAHGYPVVLVHNNQAGLLVGTLGDPVDALVVGITQSRGQELIADASIVVNVNAETIVRTDYTMYVKILLMILLNMIC